MHKLRLKWYNTSSQKSKIKCSATLHHQNIVNYVITGFLFTDNEHLIVFGLLNNIFTVFWVMRINLSISVDLYIFPWVFLHICSIISYDKDKMKMFTVNHCHKPDLW